MTANRSYQQSDGSFVLSLPYSAHRQVPWIDVAKDTGAFVSALIKAPAGTHVVGASEELSLQQWLDIWSSQIGVSARLERMDRNLVVQNDPTGIMEEMMESFEFMEEHPFDGGDPDVLSPDEVCR